MSDKNEQQLLFEIEPDWEQEWQSMPEFIQEKKEPHAKIVVRFRNEKDLEAFESLMGQKLTKKTKSMWYPFKSHFRDTPQPEWKSSEK